MVMDLKPNQICVNSEDQVVDGIVKFCKQLGFDDMIRVDYNPNIKHTNPCTHLGPGDLIGIRNEEKFLIEVEYYTPHFFTHPKYIRDMIDIVIVLADGEPRAEWKRGELASKELIILGEAIEGVEFVKDFDGPRRPRMSKEREREIVESF